MTEPELRRTPTPGVGVACFRNDQVLLVKRGKPPLEGRWSLPGGRIEWGERAADAALRELREETGCEADLCGLVDVIDGLLASSSAPETPWGHYVLIDYAARWRSGDPVAGDDAIEARFFAPTELTSLGLWSETLRVIEQARALLQRTSLG